MGSHTPTHSAIDKTWGMGLWHTNIVSSQGKWRGDGHDAAYVMTKVNLSQIGFDAPNSLLVCHLFRLFNIEQASAVKPIFENTVAGSS